MIRSSTGEYLFDNNDFADPPGSDGDDIHQVLYTETLGNYNHDLSIDESDVDTLFNSCIIGKVV